MRRVIWARGAQNDVASIRAYIGQFNPTAAQRTAARLIEVGNSLAEYPERGRAVGEGRREIVIVPPYLLRYRMDDRAVYILGIRHGARRPVP